MIFYLEFWMDQMPQFRLVLNLVIICFMHHLSYAVDEFHLFDELIKPVFDTNCIACHNSAAPQSGLDLSTVEGIKHGGAFGAVIKPGSADESEVIKRISLPEDDAFAMPPFGNKRVREENIRLIRWWINTGASFDQTLINETIPDDVREILSKKITSKNEKLQSLKPASAEEIQTVRDHGFEVREVAVRNPLLDVSVDPLTKQITIDDIAALSKISQNIATLKLGNCGLDDKLCTQLPLIPNLTKLWVNKNPITTNSVEQFKQHPKLTTLILFDTNVKDDAINILVDYPALESLYVSNTNMTLNAVEKLRQQKPTLHVIYFNE
jgi:hypothetical protein